MRACQCASDVSSLPYFCEQCLKPALLLRAMSQACPTFAATCCRAQTTRGSVHVRQGWPPFVQVGGTAVPYGSEVHQLPLLGGAHLRQTSSRVALPVPGLQHCTAGGAALLSLPSAVLELPLQPCGSRGPPLLLLLGSPQLKAVLAKGGNVFEFVWMLLRLMLDACAP